MLVSWIWLAILALGFVPVVYFLTNALYSRRRELDAPRIAVAADQISVVIPVHAQEPGVFEACLASVANQGSRVVVVGDGSLEPYRTAAMARGAEFVPLPVRVGKKAALAAGLERVVTPLVLFVDSDTVLPPGAAVRLASRFGPGVGGVGANLTVRDTGRGVAYAAEFVERAREVILRAMSSRGSVPYLDGACVMHRTELIRGYVASPGFQDLSILGRRSRLGDDWLLTDFLLRAGYRTVKAYDVRAVTTPQGSFASFVRQNVRWSRSNWIRLGSYFRRGFPRSAGRFYAAEVTATYLLPLIALATLLSRVPMVTHALSGPSGAATAAWHMLLRQFAPFSRDVWTGIARVTATLLGAFSTGAFLGAAVRTSRRPRLRLLAYGAVAMAIMFATSIYGLLSFWAEPRWDAPADPAGVRSADVAQPSRPLLP